MEAAKELREWVASNPDNNLPKHLVAQLLTASTHSEAGTSGSTASNCDVNETESDAEMLSTNDSSSVSCDISSDENKSDTIDDKNDDQQVHDKQTSIQQKCIPKNKEGTTTCLQPKITPPTEDVESPQHTAEQYLAKKSNDARRIFRHTLRMAATEAKALGVKTFKELEVKQRSWIHDRVTSVCKSLRGRERDIDDVLIPVLIQAKQYQRRKNMKEVISPKKKNKNKEDRKKDQHKVDSKKSKGGGKGTRPTRGTSTDLNKKHRKNKTSGEVQEQTHTSEYEKTIQKNIERNKTIMNAAMNENQDGGVHAGEDVIAIDSGVELANTYFVKNVDEMYSQLIFCDFINHVDGVQLPAVVLSGEVQKTEFNQLEKGDKFLWKTEKFKSNENSSIRKSSRASGPPSRLM